MDSSELVSFSAQLGISNPVPQGCFTPETHLGLSFLNVYKKEGFIFHLILLL